MPAVRRNLQNHGVRPPDVCFAANLDEAMDAARARIGRPIPASVDI
jgi:hypothetical protein